MREFYFHKELRGVKLRLAARLERYKKGYTQSHIYFWKNFVSLGIQSGG